MTQDQTGNLIIRPALPGDATTVTDFNLALAHETEHKVLDRAILSRGVELALADPTRCLYFVAASGGRIVGQTMVTFEWSDWRCGWFWWLQSVYVHPDYRQRGVFSALFNHVRGVCRERSDTCGLRLYVERQNSRAHSAYVRLGMIDAGYNLLEIDWSHDSA